MTKLITVVTYQSHPFIQQDSWFVCLVYVCRYKMACREIGVVGKNLFATRYSDTVLAAWSHVQSVTSDVCVFFLFLFSAICVHTVLDLLHILSFLHTLIES